MAEVRHFRRVDVTELTPNTSEFLSLMNENEESARKRRWLAYFQFRLEEGEIRLLRMFLDADEDMLRCETHTVKLAGAGHYTAISYVWGSGGLDHEIHLNGSRFPVRRNLYAALWNIRKNVRQWAGPRAPNELPLITTIWIDGLCIDQDNLDELASQVQHMHLLYQRAPYVYICINEDLEKIKPVTYVLRWIDLYRKDRELPNASGVIPPDPLSEPQDDSLAAYSSHLLHRFGISHRNLLAVLHAMEFGPQPGAVDTWLANCHCREDFPPSSNIFWTALASFAQLDYFRRIWCFQEYMLASKDSMFFFGPLAVRWDICQRLWNFFLGSRLIIDLGPLNVMVEMFESTLRFPLLQTTRYDQFRIQTGSAGSAAQLLLNVVHRRCSRPHDYVYGLLGVMPPDVRERITVDYNTPAGLVFASAIQETMMVALQHAHDDPDGLAMNLVVRLWDVLATVPAAVDGLPSWCPDFSNSQSALGLLEFYSGPELSPDIMNTLPGQVTYPPTSDLGTFALRVASVGIVSRCSPVIWQFGSSEEVDGVRLRRTTHQSIGNWFGNLLMNFPRLNQHNQVIGFDPAVEDYIRATVNELCDSHLALIDFDPDFECLPLDEICVVTLPNDDEDDVAAADAAAAASDEEDNNRSEADNSDASDDDHSYGSAEIREVGSGEDESTTNFTIGAATNKASDGAATEENSVLKVRAKTRLGDSIAHVLKFQQGRCIVQLETGQMGFAPRAVMPGARLCLVPGSVYLHLLSPDGDRYVSCVWIHGAEEYLSHVLSEGVNWEPVHLH